MCAWLAFWTSPCPMRASAKHFAARDIVLMRNTCVSVCSMMIALVQACSVPPLSSLGGGTVAVRLYDSAIMQTMAVRKTAADIHHYHVKLISTATNAVIAQSDTTAPITQFANVPNGSYRLNAEAIDSAGASISQGGAQASVNTVTVTSPMVGYSDNAGYLLVSLKLLDATGSCFGQTASAASIQTIAGNGTPAYAGDLGPATSASVKTPGNVAVDAAGNLIIADTMNHRIRFVPQSAGTYFGTAMLANRIYTIAGTGVGGFSGDLGPASAAMLRQPGDVAVDRVGNLLIADTFNSRIRVIARTGGTYYGQPMVANAIYTIAGTSHSGFAGDGGLASAADLQEPGGITVDGDGNVIVCDTLNDRLRCIAAGTSSLFGQAMQVDRIYTIAGTGVAGFTGDGLATSAAMRKPMASVIDGDGNVWVADSKNHRVRMIARKAGTLYGHTFQVGDIVTIAGNGTGTYSGDGAAANLASLKNPCGVTFDRQGNLFVADTDNNRLRFVPRLDGTYFGQPWVAGNVYTVCGTSTGGYSGDGGPVAAARLNGPQGATVDASGNVLVADTSNDRIRLITAVPCVP